MFKYDFEITTNCGVIRFDSAYGLNADGAYNKIYKKYKMLYGNSVFVRGI